MMRLRVRRAPWSLPVLLGMFTLLSSPLASQTIGGRLLDAQTGQPIDLGILTLFTTDGDSVAVTATTPDGGFSLTAPEPGSYRIRASAFGYAEREEGIFDLQEDGRREIELRLPSRPLELEGILVSTDRPTPDHPLIRNGFVDRYRRGRGYFITPRDLERTVYRNTESLFQFIPGVRVVAPEIWNVEGRRVVPMAASERVLMGNAWGGCTPKIYVDRVWTPYAPDAGERLSDVLPLHSIEAVEVYPKLHQIPPEYGGATGNKCGVILFWTK